MAKASKTTVKTVVPAPHGLMAAAAISQALGSYQKAQEAKLAAQNPQPAAASPSTRRTEKAKPVKSAEERSTFQKADGTTSTKPLTAAQQEAYRAKRRDA